jgi:hypothetical protein
MWHLDAPQLGFMQHFLERIEQRKRKLYQFFGDDIADVSLKDINELGLPALLHSRVPLTFFLIHLLKHHCAELLFFYLDIQQLKRKNFNHAQEQDIVSRQVFELYLESNAPFELNIPNSVTIRIAELMPAKDAFDGAVNEVMDLMQRQYLYFVKSPLFREMRHAIGNAKRLI